MPLTTERATSLAASSYTSLVEQSDLNTLSMTKKKNPLYHTLLDNFQLQIFKIYNIQHIYKKTHFF